MTIHWKALKEYFMQRKFELKIVYFDEKENLSGTFENVQSNSGSLKIY
jgi:hypothetical protein